MLKETREYSWEELGDLAEQMIGNSEVIPDGEFEGIVKVTVEYIKEEVVNVTCLGDFLYECEGSDRDTRFTYEGRSFVLDWVDLKGFIEDYTRDQFSQCVGDPIDTLIYQCGFIREVDKHE